MRSLVPCTVVALLSVLLTGCVGPSALAPVSPPALPTAHAIPNEVRWTRYSAEHRAAYLQTYAMAAQILKQRAHGRRAHSWAVILDIDETVLDNSPYQERLAQLGRSFDADSWAAWVNRREAAALPGAAAFIHQVRRLRGRVALISNRSDELCAATRDNLAQQHLEFDAVLCAPPGVTDKQPRFDDVTSGRAFQSSAVKVLLYVGDNIRDFPRLTQAIRKQGDTSFQDFGQRYFIVPNPLYGSWSDNAD